MLGTYCDPGTNCCSKRDKATANCDDFRQISRDSPKRDELFLGCFSLLF